jgi:hypothetical protein
MFDNGDKVQVTDEAEPMVGFIGEAMLGEDENGSTVVYVDDGDRIIGPYFEAQVSKYG